MSKIMIGEHEGSIYPENGGYTGAVSLGFGPDGKRKRLKRKGRTKTEVKRKLKEAIDDLEKGVKSETNYTVTHCVNDFIAHGLKGRSENTIKVYRSFARNHIIPKIGSAKLKELTADHLETWLDGLASQLSTMTVTTIHDLLTRAIRMAERRNRVARNVSALVDTPEGQIGRPSKSMDLEQAFKLLTVAQEPKWRLGAYVTVSLLTGLRTEEVRALTWADVDLEKGIVYVLRADRHGGDTKTPKSRRGLTVAQLAVQALTAHKARQATERLALGEAWQENNLIFCREDGSPLSPQEVAYDFQKITKEAGLGDHWVPRELRHTFVSILSEHGMIIEKIAGLVGHSSTVVTEKVYRHKLRPVIKGGAEAMDKIFKPRSA